LNTQSTVPPETPLEPPEEFRRRQLIEVTIDSLAELGYVGTTLAQIAGRAGVSPGLVAHYFGDKDGLLDAAFRSLARRVGDHVRARLRQISTPRARIQAVIDANLSQEEFAERYHIPLGTLRDWEQGRAEPDQPTRAYLTVIARDPDHVNRTLNPKAS